ncbi:MAG: rhodanese-like domain-containing protein [Burkholderiales bacterium]
MTIPLEILKIARERARKLGADYEGSVTPAEAHAIVQAEPAARIVDVRTKAEWEYVGRVPDAVEIEWNTYPAKQRNPNFLAELGAKVPKDAPVLFLCRSGGRSHAAALAAQQAGYEQAFNILEGFEGDTDANQHRNTVGGWRTAGLPWVQG